MDRFDLRSQIVHALDARGHKVSRTGNGKPSPFRCIRHDDSTPSAWLGDHGWGCFSCNFEEPMETLAAEVGIAVERHDSDFTLEDYAEGKGFSLDKLQRWGLHTATSKYGNLVTAIPYRDAAGQLIRTKHRHRKGTYWASDGHGTALYGLDRLAQAAPDAPVLLVEGESDCHALWHHDLVAVGLPGANGWRPEWAPLLHGRPVLLWQEPGDAGAQMVLKVGADLPGARVVSAPDIKDPAELRRSVGPSQFPAALAARIAKSMPVGVIPPVVPFVAVLGPTLDRLLAEKERPIDAVPTPFPNWNRCCGDDGGASGIARGWHCVIGATTGSGKSLAALNLAAEALKRGERVAFMSLEMSSSQLATRLLAIVSGVPVRKLEKGDRFSRDSWRAAGRIMSELHERTSGVVFVNEGGLRNLHDITQAMRYQHDVHGCRYMIVDYMQLAWAGPARSIYESIQEISHTIRATGRDLNVISVALSQFNRETSNNRDAPPTPQGLMGGSPLENDADQVVLFDHSRFKRVGMKADTWLLLAKNRHGAQREIPVVWDYETLRLSEKDERPPNAGDAWEGNGAADTSFPTGNGHSGSGHALNPTEEVGLLAAWKGRESLLASARTAKPAKRGESV